MSACWSGKSSCGLSLCKNGSWTIAVYVWLCLVAGVSIVDGVNDTWWALVEETNRHLTVSWAQQSLLVWSALSWVTIINEKIDGGIKTSQVLCINKRLEDSVCRAGWIELAVLIRSYLSSWAINCNGRSNTSTCDCWNPICGCISKSGGPG